MTMLYARPRRRATLTRRAFARVLGCVAVLAGTGLLGKVAAALADEEPTTVWWPNPSIVGAWPSDATPGSDFYAWANYDWAQEHTLSNGESRLLSSADIERASYERLAGLLVAPGPSHEEQLASLLYTSGLDWDRRDAVGFDPVRPFVDAVLAAGTIDELNAVLAATPHTFTLVPVVTAAVSTDIRDATSNILIVGVPSFILRDPAEYTNPTDVGLRMREAFETFAHAVLERYGFSADEARQMVCDCLAFEGLIAPSCTPLAAQQGADWLEAIYNVYAPDEVAELLSHIPVLDILRVAGLGDVARCLVTEPDALAVYNDAYTNENLHLIKAWVVCAALIVAAEYADAASNADAIACVNTINGSTGAEPQEQRILGQIDQSISAQELLGSIYASAYLDDRAKADVEAIVEQVIQTFEQRLERCDWLGDETRARAIEKLQALTHNIGEPSSRSVDWGALELDPAASYLENTLLVQEAVLAAMLGRADQPADPGIWADMGAHTVNAFYDATNNSANFPAALLQPPFYDPEASFMENLGGIGTVIAHEITHAFDSNGAQFDKDGNQTLWWTEEDYAAFVARADAVGARYASIESVPGVFMEADAVVGEAVADLGSLRCCLDIAHAQGAENDELERFFKAFASIWACLTTLEDAQWRLKYDVHPPTYLRVNVTAQQVPEFYDVFGIVEGDRMYVAPEERLAVW